MSRRTVWFVTGGLAATLILAFGMSPYASSQPDGLERVAVDQTLDTNEVAHVWADGPFADYSTRGIEDAELATGIAGVIGVIVTFALAGGLAWGTTLVARRHPASDEPDAMT